MRALVAGSEGLLLEVDSAAQVAALHAELLRRRAELGPVRDIVPAARTVLLDGVREPRALAERIARWEVPPLAGTEGPLITVPVRYDGPDLAEVARLWDVTEREVAGVVGSLVFRVAFCGFAPGFGYLTGLPERLHLPRRATPRAAVPAGSLALAGEYAGVYPRSSPGGWQLIGTTDAVLWDPERDPAALFAPGVRVRFEEAGT
ncbi:allophanate hydrolase subunit 1 [Streptomyces goshikiensis]|uniref:5-oxoprolinase subunit B family protein n=1 Tax=Streptomyces TaxID=1883 RepID=UPI00093B8408|nr:MULTISPECIES: allophanate hydrolase subunit 1 [unclassified Streptomyces]OKI49507.1 allophanate hydrolase [Streptomyces sp. MJM1172]PJN17261.1 allophanate hydrolase subunit 1 [Streptomyces sp. CB02120-2]